MSEELAAEVAAEVPAEVAAEQPTDEVTQTAEGEKPEKPPKLLTEEQVNAKIEKRLARAKRSFERQLQETLERERQNFAAQQPKPQQPEGAPKLEQFDNLDDYVAAKAEWVADQKLEKAFAEREQAARLQAEQGRRGQVEQTWNSRVSQVRVEMPDFDEVIESSGVSISQPMAEAIMESDVGPKVAYYLARNPDLAEEIAEMSPAQIHRAIGRIEAKLETEPLVKKQSSAPKPASPVGSRASNDNGLSDKLSVDDWLRARNAQLKAKRG